MSLSLVSIHEMPSVLQQPLRTPTPSSSGQKDLVVDSSEAEYERTFNMQEPTCKQVLALYLPQASGKQSVPFVPTTLGVLPRRLAPHIFPSSPFRWASGCMRTFRCLLHCASSSNHP